MAGNSETPLQSTRSGFARYGVALATALLGFGLVYGIFSAGDTGAPEPHPVEGKGTAAATGSSPKLNRGAMTSFVLKRTPAELPDVAFVDGSGAPRTLKDFRGKTVLLNLWATWCAPCREEMPALDRLEKDLGSEKFEVVALAVDRGGIAGARKFLDGIKVENLKLYADATTRSGTALKAIGMPTTILIDREGREVGRLPGPAEWDSPEAKTLIEANLR
jgi:thiol-disulfide isomerase/thioredoxin